MIETAVVFGPPSPIAQIYFPTDGSTLDNQDRCVLDKFCHEVTTLLSHGMTMTISITGGADQRGPEEHNVMLGARRAKSVKAYISEHTPRESKLSIQQHSIGEQVSDRHHLAEERRVDIYVRKQKYIDMETVVIETKLLSRLEYTEYLSIKLEGNAGATDRRELGVDVLWRLGEAALYLLKSKEFAPSGTESKEERKYVLKLATVLVNKIKISTETNRVQLACPFIIGPRSKLGFLEGGALEEKIYRRTDRPGIGGSGSRDGGSGRVPQAQCFRAIILSLESQVRWYGRLGGEALERT